MIRLLAALALMQQAAAQATPPAASQSPSPMQEQTRAHERLVQKDLDGIRRTIAGPGGKPIEVFVSKKRLISNVVDLVVHFHGAAWVPEQAVTGIFGPMVSAAVNVGAGSGIYDRAFSDPAAFDSLLSAVDREVSAVMGKPVKVERVTLVGFSAGHGAIRAILREPRHFARVATILLLDGMHTSYIPEGSLLATGASLDTTNLVAFAAFARAAVRREKRFVITHSEIFPGTFASTTETADWLLRSLGLRRIPVLIWGPRGMQQLSAVRSGRFEVLGFAGNSAPDHIDHLHAMPEFLDRTLRGRNNDAAMGFNIGEKTVHHFVYW